MLSDLMYGDAMLELQNSLYAMENSLDKYQETVRSVTWKERETATKLARLMKAKM